MQDLKFTAPDYTVCEFVNLVSKWPQGASPKPLEGPRFSLETLGDREAAGWCGSEIIQTHQQLGGDPLVKLITLQLQVYSQSKRASRLHLYSQLLTLEGLS